jgi:SAM-dependent methyltransferase
MSSDSDDGYAYVADLYDHVVPYRERPDVGFFVEEARNAGGPVLEVGCGTGRILIPTARAGVRTVGLDRSPRMLDMCRDRLGRESPTVQAAVELVEADMRDFRLDQSFALATFPFRSFQHLVTVADQVSCLRNVRSHLVNGGRMILDVFNPSIDALANRRLGEESGDEPEFTMPDGRRVVRRHRIVAHDPFRQLNQAELIYDITHPDGREERLVHAFAMRYLFRYEVEHLLARCGFHLEHIWAGYDRSEYGSRYPGELVCLARKVEGTEP